jgi:hypothetical protein
MVILGLLLILAGAILIVAAVITGTWSDSATDTILGVSLSPNTMFFLGVASGAAVLWGFSILKYGTRRGIEHRRERRKLDELSRKLDEAEARKDREET